jgi:hypothetical protein
MLPWAATRLAVLGDQGLLSVHKGSYPRWQGGQLTLPPLLLPPSHIAEPLLTSNVLASARSDL